jgi:hypothetical protein
VGLFVLTASVCDDKKSPYTPDQLAALPEAQLRYPGSVILYGPQGQPSGLLNPRTTWNYRAATDDSPDSVVAFFKRELEARGWHRSPEDERPAQPNLTRIAWRKDVFLIGLGFYPQGAGSPTAQPGQSTPDQTVFGFSIEALSRDELRTQTPQGATP